jgi:hypothetical protein
MDPLGGRFIATGSLDGVIKLWAVQPLLPPSSGSAEVAARARAIAALQRAVPPHQAFTGHPSAVLGRWDCLSGWVKGGRPTTAEHCIRQEFREWATQAGQPCSPDELVCMVLWHAHLSLSSAECTMPTHRWLACPVSCWNLHLMYPTRACVSTTRCNQSECCHLFNRVHFCGWRAALPAAAVAYGGR